MPITIFLCGIINIQKIMLVREIVSNFYFFIFFSNIIFYYLFILLFSVLKDIKKTAAQCLGLSLITVPCWWNGTIEEYV